jgi:hypothetical protein
MASVSVEDIRPLYMSVGLGTNHAGVRIGVT